MNYDLLIQDIIVTMSRVFLWTTLSWLTGVLIGFLCSRSKPIAVVLLPINHFMRHISPFCWLPVVILISGIGEISVGLILFAAMFFNAVLIVFEAIKAVPREYIEHAHMDGAYGIRLIRFVEIPLLKQDLVNTYRILWSVGWTAVIAAEMLGVRSGMGFRLLDFRYLLLYPQMFTYIIIIGLLGIGIDIMLARIKAYIAYA